MKIKNQKDNSKVIAGIFLLLILLILPLTYKHFLSIFGNFLVIEDNLYPVDVIHIIAGDNHRTDYGIKLYNQGYGQQIFFTGGWCDRHKFFHGKHGKNRSLRSGIPIETINFDDSTVKSTFSEAVKLKEYLDQNTYPILSVIVVSEPYHMRRIRWTYKMVLGNEIRIVLAPVPFELTDLKKKWWSDKRSRKFVIKEYGKLIYYYARYKFSWGTLKDWLASLDKE